MSKRNTNNKNKPAASRVKRKEYYKIGEISALYGIGTDSLRYYEEIGILKPRRDDNGYRMYSIKDIRTLNILRELRSIGYSMTDIQEHLSNFDIDKTLDLFEKEISFIDDKIQELFTLKSNLQNRIAQITEHKLITKTSKVELRHIPERKVLRLTENVYRDEDLDFVIKKLQRENEEQLYIIGNSHIGATIPLDYLSSGNYGHFNSVFCVTENDDFDETIEAGTYLCITAKGSYRKLPELWKTLLDEVKSRQLKACSDPMELYIIDNHATNNENEYITELQILVTP